MTLNDYFAGNASLTEAEFASQIGVDQSTVNRLRKKGQIPKPAVMTRIYEHTNGAVTANDFFGIAA